MSSSSNNKTPPMKRSASSPLPDKNTSPFSPAARRTAATRLPAYLASFEDVEEESIGGGSSGANSGFDYSATSLSSSSALRISVSAEGGDDAMRTPKRNLAKTLPASMWSPASSPSEYHHPPPPPVPPEEKGFRLKPEDLEFQGRLAEGAYGVVWRARLRSKQLAVKVQRLPCDEQEQANLLCELMILQGLSHPRMVCYEGAAFLEADQARSRPDWVPLLQGPSPPKPSSSNLSSGATTVASVGAEKEEEGGEEHSSSQLLTTTPSVLVPPSEDPLILIAMELCARGSLRQGLQSGESIAWPLKVRIAGDIAEGLAFLHGQGLIHRDLKTTNILLDAGWRAKICDHSFAIAQRSPDISSFTCGTLEFMSPEVALGEPYDAKCDMFSLGIVICEMASEKEPGVNNFLVRRAKDLFQLPSSDVQDAALPDCPPSLLNLALQCVQNEAEHRPTAREAFEWAQSLFAELGSSAPVLPAECNSPSSNIDKDPDDDEEYGGHGRPPSYDGRKGQGANGIHGVCSPAGTSLGEGSSPPPYKGEGKSPNRKNGDSAKHGRDAKDGAKHGYDYKSDSSSSCDSKSSSSSAEAIRRHGRGRRRSRDDFRSTGSSPSVDSLSTIALNRIMDEVSGLRKWKDAIERQQERLMKEAGSVRDNVGAILSSVTAYERLLKEINLPSTSSADAKSILANTSSCSSATNKSIVVLDPSSILTKEGVMACSSNSTAIEGWERQLEASFQALVSSLKDFKLEEGEGPKKGKGDKENKENSAKKKEANNLTETTTTILKKKVDEMANLMSSFKSSLMEMESAKGSSAEEGNPVSFCGEVQNMKEN